LCLYDKSATIDYRHGSAVNCRRSLPQRWLLDQQFSGNRLVLKKIDYCLNIKIQIILTGNLYSNHTHQVLGTVV